MAANALLDLAVCFDGAIRSADPLPVPVAVGWIETGFFSGHGPCHHVGAVAGIVFFFDDGGAGRQRVGVALVRLGRLWIDKHTDVGSLTASVFDGGSTVTNADESGCVVFWYERCGAGAAARTERGEHNQGEKNSVAAHGR